MSTMSTTSVSTATKQSLSAREPQRSALGSDHEWLFQLLMASVMWRYLR